MASTSAFENLYHLNSQKLSFNLNVRMLSPNNTIAQQIVTFEEIHRIIDENYSHLYIRFLSSGSLKE
jgi:hypothetical protein